MIGVYNAMAKKFQFNIAETSVAKARRRLFEKIGKDAYKWRWEYRYIPGSIVSDAEKIYNRKYGVNKFSEGRRLEFAGSKGTTEMVDNKGTIHATMDDGSYIKISIHDEVKRLKNYE